MLSFEELKSATGMHVHDIVRALRNGDFPRPTMQCGRELWWESEVLAWVANRPTMKGMPR
jgi:predicted DNA-binding transcriptional regulator AlpA